MIMGSKIILQNVLKAEELKESVEDKRCSVLLILLSEKIFTYLNDLELISELAKAPNEGIYASSFKVLETTQSADHSLVRLAIFPHALGNLEVYSFGPIFVHKCFCPHKHGNNIIAQLSHLSRADLTKCGIRASKF